MKKDDKAILADELTNLIIKGKLVEAVKLLVTAGHSDARGQVAYYRLFLVKQGKVKA